MTRKFALIIGNSQYDDANLAQLTAPAADVRALDELLRAPEIGGFDAVQTLENHPFAEVHPAIADFFADKKPDDLLLLYFSGHGLLDPQGRLYLAVKNSRNDRLSGSAIPSLFLKDEMDNSRARRQVLILDCCQSGAFGQGAKSAPGAQAITDATFEGRGRAVLTATDKTQPAWEGNRIIGGVETSIFTHFIIEGLKTGAAADDEGRITPTRLYDFVFPKVVEAVPTQKPRLIVYDREGGDIVIARSPRPPAPKLPPELQQAIDSPFAGIRGGAVEELGRLLKGSDPALAQAARQVLEQMLNDDSRRVSELAAKALAEPATAKSASETSHELMAQQAAEEMRQKLAEYQDVLRKTQEPPKSEPAVHSAHSPISNLQSPAADRLIIEHPFHLELIRIPAGEFLMGSDPGKDEYANESEQPQHRVYVSEFYIGKYSITNTQYTAFKKVEIPSGKENHPVVSVSWKDAVAFCEWLSKETGKPFRLPTEAEWEKAARGADGRIYPWGNEWDQARLNSSEGGPGTTTPVGAYSPQGDSPYGLADMSGNVWEWTSSLWGKNLEKPDYRYPYNPKDGRENLNVSDDVRRVVRGGAWYFNRNLCRPACRLRLDPANFNNNLGFRPALSPVLRS